MTDNKRIAKNTLLLYARMLFMMVIGLYTSRVILDKLGEVDYGIYNVVGGFVTMFSVISGAMTSATQRFLSFEIGKKEEGDVRSIFSTMVFIHIFLAIVILFIGETLGVWFLNSHMNFPLERYDAANWVFQLSLFTFMLNVINVPYNAALIAYERMSAFAYFSIFDAIFKLAICYVIIMTPFDRLIVYAILMALIQGLLIVMYYLYCRKHFSDCRFCFHFNRTYGREVFSFVGWNLIGSVAGVAKEQGINVVLNMFFGPTVNAARGVAYQVLAKVNGFVSNFQMAMNPQIIKLYAANERDQMYKLVFRGAKLSFLLLLTLSLPIIIEAPFILSLWLKEVPEYTTIFLRLVLFIALLSTLSNPLIISMHASGKVRDYQIVVGGISLLTLPLVYVAFRCGYEPYNAMVIAFIIELFCHVARLYMLKRTIDFPMILFLKDVTFRVMSIAIVSIVLSAMVYLEVESVLFRVLSVCVVSVCSVLLLGYYLGFNKHDRNQLKNKVISFISKKMKKNEKHIRNS